MVGARDRKVAIPLHGPAAEVRRAPLAMQGATVKAIQELAGHQDITTTQRYMHLSPAHKDAAIRLLDRPPVDDAPFDSAPPAAALRSGRTGELARSGRAGAEAFGDILETTPPGGTKPNEVE